MKSILEDWVRQALKQELELENIDFSVDQPPENAQGDYATNVALVVAKSLKISPREIAQKLLSYFQNNPLEIIEVVEISGGFINFKLKKTVFANFVKDVLNQKSFFQNNSLKDQKVLVEHSSPNLFKPFHIGHLMNNTIGEAVSRLAKNAGAQVTTLTFPSDISLGIAKAIFIILEKLGEDQSFIWRNVSVLGEAYVEGTKRYEAEESAQSRIKEIANNLYQNIPSVELDLFQEAKALNIDYFKQITRSLGSEFDDFIYESQAGILGKELVLANTPQVFTKSQGAIVYIPPETRTDINTAVFINSEGNPTYEAKDLGLLKIKFDKYHPDLSIFITDNQQVAHFKVVLASAEKINQTWVEKSLHLHHGRMSFKGQKMSSRLGGVPTVEETLAAVKEDVLVRNPEIVQNEAQKVAIASLKFAILRSAIGRDIDFDPEVTLSFEGDSGPYLLYSAVRARSLLNKKGEIAISTTLPVDWQTIPLEKELIHFDEILVRATYEWSPHYLISYLLKLARTFNSWYGQTQIIDPSDPSSSYKLALTESFVRVLEKGLELLGIEVPEKM